MTWKETSFKPRDCIPRYFVSEGDAAGNSYLYAVNSDVCWAGDVAINRNGALVNPGYTSAGDPGYEAVIKTSALSEEEALVATYERSNKRERYIYTTSDTGTTWTRHRLPEEAQADTLLPLSLTVFWVGQFRTLDGGASWEKLEAIPSEDELKSLDVSTLIMNYGSFFNSYGRMRLVGNTETSPVVPGFVITMDKDLLFFRFEDSGNLFLSKDRGNNWQLVSNGDSLRLHYLLLSSVRSDYVPCLSDPQCFVDDSTFYIGYCGDMEYQMWTHGLKVKSPMKLVFTHDSGTTWQEPSHFEFPRFLYTALIFILALLLIVFITLLFISKDSSKV